VDESWNPVPCLILGFTRKDCLEKLIDNLINQRTPRIYISLDGPRNLYDRELQKSILTMLNNFQNDRMAEILIRRNEENLGLRRAVLEGVSWFFEHEEFGVILEDDLEIHPRFQEYFALALENDQVYENCMSVSGNQFLDFQNSSVVRYPLIWGWGTWNTSWQIIRAEIEDISNLQLPWFKKPFLSGFVKAGLMRISGGILDSWALIFLAKSISNNWLHLVPPFQIVSNSGDDPFATHTTSIPLYAKSLSWGEKRQLLIPVKLGQNWVLEKFISRKHYRVRFWHIFSPLKAWVVIYLQRRNEILR